MRALKPLLALGLAGWMCSFCFFIAVPNLMVANAIPQLPFGNSELAQWQLDIPQDTDGATGTSGVGAGASRVGRDGYRSTDAQAPWGVPLRGPIRHWSNTHDKPLLGCGFQDPNYTTHVGVDFPVNAGTPVYATMSGKVVWAGDNGAWGGLVVVENGDYQTWFAHNESITVQVGDTVQAGQVVAASGNTGNSTGPHVHYGIKHFNGDDDAFGTWLNPMSHFSSDEVIEWPCGD
ncbi:MAG: M23 family metallopeptidase [Anaerolineales bacterium]|nr:M23 family metallopeptidase [Anaerolineales bacterium]